MDFKDSDERIWRQQLETTTTKRSSKSFYILFLGGQTSLLSVSFFKGPTISSFFCFFLGGGGGEFFFNSSKRRDIFKSHIMVFECGRNTLCLSFSSPNVFFFCLSRIWSNVEVGLFGRQRFAFFTTHFSFFSRHSAREKRRRKSHLCQNESFGRQTY